ncbi:hypothetical protein [Streptomyces sp. NPDC059262]|uniref:hypothetical protein n=1 Tax=Streptomyces sp. NPDC059262 TaxID=3346797 RepID=UPI0036C08A83
MFATEYPRKAFTDKILKRCEEIMREMPTDFEAELKRTLVPHRRRANERQPAHAE